MRDFRDFQVWHKAHALALAVYRETALFPRDERYGLVSQMRRSSASIPSNIAEGCGRGGGFELARYLQIAMGSASELEYQLLLARDLGFLAQAAYGVLDADVIEVKRMLAPLIRRMRGEPTRPHVAESPAR